MHHLRNGAKWSEMEKYTFGKTIPRKQNNDNREKICIKSSLNASDMLSRANISFLYTRTKREYPSRNHHMRVCSRSLEPKTTTITTATS